MANYYLDIETTGFNFKEDKIITIQYQRMDSSGNPYGELRILKEWESNEEDIVKRFYKEFMGNNVWDFIPILTNHIFDLTFLFEKFNKYGLKCPPLSEFLFTKPFIDVKYSLIIANKLSFKGSGLDQMTRKATDGRNIPIWYESKEFSKIEGYIVQEKESFIELFKLLLKTLPEEINKLK